MKKTSRDIHPRNIPTNFEKNPNIGCRVRGVDGRTDRQTDRPTDRPTTRHGNRSSGPKKEPNLTFLAFQNDILDDSTKSTLLQYMETFLKVIGIVFNVAGCLISGRRRWSVTYTSPRGLRILKKSRIWNRRAFQERKPYQFPGWMKNSPYYSPGRTCILPSRV